MPHYFSIIAVCIGIYCRQFYPIEIVTYLYYRPFPTFMQPKTMMCCCNSCCC